jgi:TusA-related sulfurtransferase
MYISQRRSGTRSGVKQEIHARIAMDIREIRSQKVLDTRGLHYPMQLRKIETALRAMAAGDILEIWDTDPHSQKEIPESGTSERSEFIGNIDDPEGYTRYYIRKG